MFSLFVFFSILTYHRILNIFPVLYNGFPGGSDGKKSACNAVDPGSIPGVGRSPGKGNGNLLQCSCLEDPWMDQEIDYHIK